MHETGPDDRRAPRGPRSVPTVSLLAVGAALVVLASYLTLVSTGTPTAAHEQAGTTRTHHIAADPVLWDYPPAGRNEITGEAFDEEAGVFVTAGPVDDHIVAGMTTRYQVVG